MPANRAKIRLHNFANTLNLRKLQQQLFRCSMRLRGCSIFADRTFPTIPVCNPPFSSAYPCPQCGLVFFSYAIVTKEFVKFFVHETCLNPEALKSLEDEKVEVLPYEDFFETISSLQLCTSEEVRLPGSQCAVFDAAAEGPAWRQGEPCNCECDREGQYEPTVSCVYQYSLCRKGYSLTVRRWPSSNPLRMKRKSTGSGIVI